MSIRTNLGGTVVRTASDGTKSYYTIPPTTPEERARFSAWVKADRLKRMKVANRWINLTSGASARGELTWAIPIQYS